MRPKRLDDTFHDLKVKVDRPGVETRYRGGYFSEVEKTPVEKGSNVDRA